MKFIIFFIFGIAIGIMVCVHYFRRNYSLYKNEPPREVVLNETMSSMKSKEYLCPWCGSLLPIKLYPNCFDVDYTGECSQIVFGYSGSTNGSVSYCSECKNKIEWPPIHMLYSHKVQGCNNCKKIIKQVMLREDIDWEEWLKNEKLL